jgi:hypothetical protein
MSGRDIWRSIVLYALFAVLLIAGWQELPGGDSILPWYVIGDRCFSGRSRMHLSVLALTGQAVTGGFRVYFSRATLRALASLLRF